ncbi:MAG TPA: ATP-binding protein [Methylomirabilota bacterium]|jgi:PAS domain S-box-containing protein|nr:ATP-binding protein [Methylomirabilota bacterium]
MNNTETQSLLLIEDNPGDARLIREALRGESTAEFTLVHVERLCTALTQLAQAPFAVILLDLTLPDSEGFDTIRKVQEGAPQTPVVVLTGVDDEELAIKAVQEGAQDYLIKGQFDPRTLTRSLRYAIERQRLQQEVRASEERYRNLFESASDGILSLTFTGVITAVNRAVETMLGWSREELIEQHIRKILTPASTEVVEERLRRSLAGEPPSVLPSMAELEAIRADGGVVPIEIRENLLWDSQGKLRGSLLMARDISGRKALERQRAEFLAMLTHDIKNPLMAIMGYTDYLIEGASKLTAAKREEVLPWIKSNALTILSLVNNYLDLLRIEDKQLTLTRQPVNLNELLQRLSRQYGVEARRRQITLEVQLDRLPLWTEGDPLALERIFANLVYNALKFTPKNGSVNILSTVQENSAVITVADTGPGLPPEEIPGLFEKYRRSISARQKEGWGLGLFIVKLLVEAHNGRIAVESTPGAGARFHVFLPLKAAGSETVKE